MTHRTLPRALSLALALAVASFGALFSAGSAQAESRAGEAGAHEPTKGAAPAPAKAKAKAAHTSKSKAKKGAAAKAGAPGKAHAKPDKTASKPAKTKRTAARETKPATKRAKPQPKADDSPRPGAASSAKPCNGTVVSLDRGGVEADRITLVDCRKKPLDEAVSKVSILARPWGAPRSVASKAGRVDAGVITRLAAVAAKFPGRTISVIGGPRPTAGGSSAHHAGRALDLRIDGVENEKLVEVCRSLPDTGCGYYPNASFVHVDVRTAGAGKAFWIDASEPGEPPRYVTSWPPPQTPAKRAEASK